MKILIVDAHPPSAQYLCQGLCQDGFNVDVVHDGLQGRNLALSRAYSRSEEHTSELQSPCNLVCRLLLEKKKLTCSRYPFRRCPASIPAPLRRSLLSRRGSSP